jgi:hypothetical protein
MRFGADAFDFLIALDGPLGAPASFKFLEQLQFPLGFAEMNPLLSDLLVKLLPASDKRPGAPLEMSLEVRQRDIILPG